MKYGKEIKMNAHRKAAIVVDVLFIIATAFLFVGEAFHNPILKLPEYLEITYPNRTTVITGVLPFANRRAEYVLNA